MYFYIEAIVMFRPVIRMRVQGIPILIWLCSVALSRSEMEITSQADRTWISSLNPWVECPDPELQYGDFA
jgi:hypothetical protein